MGEGVPWVDAFIVVEASVCINHENVFFILLAKFVKERAEVV